MTSAPSARARPSVTPTRPAARAEFGVTDFIKTHPVLAYYAVVFAISWGGVLLLIGGPASIPGAPEQIDRLIWFVVLTLELGPPIAALVLTGLVSGRAGYAELLRRLATWRVDARWYALVFLTAPVVATAALLVLSLTSQAYTPGILASSDWSSAVLVAVITGLLGGFGEELGWTGFAIPRLRLQHSLAATGLFVGVLWGVWHYLVTPAWIAGTFSGELPLTVFLTANGALALVGYLTPYRVLMVWVYERSGSLLLASLMHTSLIATTLFLLAPVSLAGMAYVTWSATLAAGFWIALAVVRIINGPLSRPSTASLAY